MEGCNNLGEFGGIYNKNGDISWEMWYTNLIIINCKGGVIYGKLDDNCILYL